MWLLMTVTEWLDVIVIEYDLMWFDVIVIDYDWVIDVIVIDCD